MGFQLLRDSLDGSLEPLAVPAGLSYLEPDLTVSARRPRRRPPLLVFEAVRWRGRPALLAFCPSEERVRLNGAPMPVLAALNIKDQLLVDGGALLHVSSFEGGLRDAPPQPGATCPICRTPVDEGPVHVCPCGTVFHCTAELECARLATGCPSCHAPLRLEEGLVYEPET